jgi:hypothetical protein
MDIKNLTMDIGKGALAGVCSTAIFHPTNTIYVKQMQKRMNIQSVIKQTSYRTLYAGFFPNLISISMQNATRLPTMRLFESISTKNDFKTRCVIGFAIGAIGDTLGQHIPFVRKNMDIMGMKIPKGPIWKNLNVYKRGLVPNVLRNGYGFMMAYAGAEWVLNNCVSKNSKSNPLIRLGITTGFAYLGLSFTIPAERLVILKIQNANISYKNLIFEKMIPKSNFRIRGLTTGIIFLSEFYRGFLAKGVFIGGNNSMTMLFKNFNFNQIY